MIVASGITMQFGAKPLFENVSVKFGGGNRYGLIGANGCGKSTFMQILGGDLEPSAGSIAIDSNERLGRLRQDQFGYEQERVLDVVLMGHEQMWNAMRERDAIYNNAEASEEDFLRAADLEAKYAEYGGYTAEARAGELLLGLGVPMTQHNGPMSEVAPGSPTVFIDTFPTASGRVKLVPADIIPANERPDAAYPFVLITGRQLEHWHTGSMTRRAKVLDAIEPMATASMCGADLKALGMEAGDIITIASRRGEVALHVRRDDGTPQGAVFVPFAYYEAAANELTNSALDPFGKIPEFKYCAVAVSKGGTTRENAGFGVNAPETHA